jgi:hypothetical protein
VTWKPDDLGLERAIRHAQRPAPVPDEERRQMAKTGRGPGRADRRSSHGTRTMARERPLATDSARSTSCIVRLLTPLMTVTARAASLS